MRLVFVIIHHVSYLGAAVTRRHASDNVHTQGKAITG